MKTFMIVAAIALLGASAAVAQTTSKANQNDCNALRDHARAKGDAWTDTEAKPYMDKMTAMKMNLARPLFWTVVLAFWVTFYQASLCAQVTNTIADKVVKRAVFVVPTNAREGCDPFYPDSITRQFFSAW